MNEEMRKEFEEWCKQQWFVNLEIENDIYISSKTNILWQAWRASRRAMKSIKLPELPSVHAGYTKHEICFMAYAIDECKEAIEQAGYKVEV